ncbi:hypothetical protein Y032_0472g2059 [Ancylostoma ceylanicum]|uniref:Reverse transcriptase domain-containing protein n=1 Tax=Ancylostoma ceylanicum TaxID=53326 RepID=A0A016WYL1_9BILA|nr:hypothetical protein Y032_0472g2059 [Ancylostoma ceylanicum]
MTKNGTIRLSVSDKGGEFVVMPQVLDREITELHLQDSTLYCRVTEKDFHNQCKHLNDVWTTIGKSCCLDERFLSRLKIDTPTCPVFYSLIKTHKLAPHDLRSMSADTYKIRPIISCVGGPADRISWFLNKIVGPILSKIPSHLPNTNHFLKQLHKARFDNGCVIESFDVASLYTNVQNGEAMQALSEMLNLYGSHLETYGLSRTGQRLAPVLAICFMSRIEAPVLTRIPIMYCRYIDDCCVITSTQSEMDECFRILNQQSQYIKLTREKPSDGWLPFLNTQISLSGGQVRVKWYRKESCKNILIHARSAHPIAMKRAVIRNMFKTAVELCTGDDERKESRKLASDIAGANGYTVFPRHNKSHTVSGNIPKQSKIPLCLPFITDTISAAVRRCIVQSQLQDDVILVNIPNNNIRSQLVRKTYSENKGVYLSDAFEKSSHYCETSAKNYRYMILCRTALGKNYQLKSWNYSYKDEMPKGYDSLHAFGQQYPKTSITINGVAMPLCDFGNHSQNRYAPLQFSEYIVKDSTRVLPQYLVIFQ